MKLKRFLIRIHVLVLLLVLISSCKEAITDPTGNEEVKNFFPDVDGSRYGYSVAVFDSTGLIQSGFRKSYFDEDTLLQLTNYKIKVDTFNLNDNLSIYKSYFRKSTSGIFGFFDTTGIASIIPDSLRNLISLSNEYRLLFFPLSVGQTWPVYNVSVDLGISRIDILNLSSEVVTKDSVNIAFSNNNFQKEVFKIRYDLEIITGLDLTSETYQAFAWIAEDLGFYKWEGDSEILNFFIGNNVYPFETIVIEQLSGFEIP
jgi:hypothetical protein